MEECLFCKIVRGDIPSNKIYEDDHVLAFLDINPVSPGHTLVIPKKHCKNLLDMPEADVGHVYTAAKKVALGVKAGIEAEGLTVSMSNEPAGGQVVFHAHVHVIPRYENDGLHLWSGKPYQEGQADEVQKRIVKKL